MRAIASCNAAADPHGTTGPTAPHPRAGRLIAEVVTMGSVNRTDAVDILRLTDRYGREQIRILIQQGLVAASEREPLRPAFPLKTVPWCRSRRAPP